MNRSFNTLLVSVALPISLLAFTGCKKDDPPPPLPSAASAAPEPNPVLAIEPVPDVVPDAGVPVKKGGGGVASPAANLQACCNALAQNAASAPEPNATYMKQAAGTCGVLAAQGKDKGTLIAAIAGLLKGAGLPAACK
ncbi:MAG TPA: hypothetical protein VKP30_15460 [Polyangiaceae bacterium]|nr:hypothetical protein [Polyangiaceae bacterium]